MLYLVPASHGVQFFGGPAYEKEEVIAFGEFLVHFVNSKEVKLIAEEFSKAAIKKWKAKGSTCKLVAKLCKIDHCFCDPEPEDRVKLNVPQDDMDGEGWDTREKEWLKKLKKSLDEKKATVFVYGAKHTDSFCKLLEAKGYKDIEVVDWKNERVRLIGVGK